MAKGSEEQKDWQVRVRSLGFRQAGIRYLRERLAREKEKERLDMLIRRLSKYEPHQQIVRILLDNPGWQPAVGELIAELPEVKAEPEIHFIFPGGGNIPNVPLLRGQRLYFGSGESFYALDAESGQVVWRLQSPGATWSGACLADDLLYVCSAGRLYCLSPKEGARQWCFQVKRRLTAPYCDGGRVFVGSEEGTLYALDARTGNRLWTFNVTRSIFVAPAAWQDRIFAASRDHRLYAVGKSDGECLWHFSTEGQIYGYPHLSEGVVYLGSADHRLYALLAASGQLLWNFPTGGEIYSSPLEKEGVVYLGSRDRHLYALRAEDGRELWRHKLLGYPSSASVERGMIYFSAQGRIYAFGRADRKMHWCFPLGATVATSPVVGRKRIYAGTLEGRLFCLKLEVQLDEEAATQVVKRLLAAKLEPTPAR